VWVGGLGTAGGPNGLPFLIVVQDGRSLLHLSSASGCVPLIQLLAQHNGKEIVNKKDEEGGIGGDSC
jgi:hypothetical protein